LKVKWHKDFFFCYWGQRAQAGAGPTHPHGAPYTTGYVAPLPFVSGGSFEIKLYLEKIEHIHKKKTYVENSEKNIKHTPKNSEK
jgi:hypothetical protein